MDRLEHLEKRIQALEQRNRRVMTVAAAAGLLAAVVWMTTMTTAQTSSAPTSAPTEFRARRFVIVDDSGHPVGWLGSPPYAGASKDGPPQLRLFDGGDETCITGGSIELSDSDLVAPTSIFLDLGGESAASLRLCDSHGTRAQIGLDRRERRPFISLNRAAKKPLPIEEFLALERARNDDNREETDRRLHDARPQEALTLGWMELQNPATKERITRSESSIIILDSDQNVIQHIP